MAGSRLFASPGEVLFYAGVVVANVLLDVLLLWGTVAVDRYVRDLATLAGVEGFVLATFFTQLVVLAIWSALFPGPNLLRVATGTLVWTASANLIGYVASHLSLDGYILLNVGAPRSSFGFASSGLVLIVVFFAVQIPFWVLRYLLALHVRRKDVSAALPQRAGQVSALEVLGLTAIVAVALGLARPDIELLGLERYLLVIVPLSALSIGYGLPYMWVALGRVGPLKVVVVIVAVTMPMLVIGSVLFCWIEQVRPRNWGYVVAAFAAVQLASLVVGLGNGYSARCFGFRLSRGAPIASG